VSIWDGHRVVPVIVLDDPDHAVPLAEALLEGGIRIIEVTFRTPAAAESISRIASALPEMNVGAGTVVTLEEARRAVDSGSQFGLAPGCAPETIRYFQKHNIPFVPGIMTPSEIQSALSLDCRVLKFFPAEAAGGVAMLKNLLAPYQHFGLKVCPTGGISPTNMDSYLALKPVFAVGGSWIATREQIRNRDWAGITAQACAAL